MAWIEKQPASGNRATPYRRRGRSRPRTGRRGWRARWSRADTIALALACIVLVGYAAWERYAPSGPTSPGGVTFCSYDPKGNCLADGDSGQHDGMRWRMVGYDSPEIGSAECAQEKRLAFKARARLQELMAAGYRLHTLGAHDKHGRALVTVVLPDGRDAGQVLLDEGLSQPWPNTGNVWCDQQDAKAPQKKISR